MVDKVNANRPSWSRSLQTIPPNFGKSKRLPSWIMNLSVWYRRKQAIKIIDSSNKYENINKGVVSLVILSCKRLPELKRLCDTLVPFFNNVEDYEKIEKILVDNGSGQELIDYVKSLDFFDLIIEHSENIGMAGALNDVYHKCSGEYILLIEDDMVIECSKPFIKDHIEVFDQYPEIGIIRLKNQNNWWKPFRIIGDLRSTVSNNRFYTWFPSLNREYNVWSCGSVLFRKISFFDTGDLPFGQGREQAVQVENVYARKYNKKWLAAKMENIWPVVQPNDNNESPGFSDKTCVLVDCDT